MEDDFLNQFENYKHVWQRLFKLRKRPIGNSSELRYWKKYYSKTKKHLWKHY
jgi:hypothetical protein